MSRGRNILGMLAYWCSTDNFGSIPKHLCFLFAIMQAPAVSFLDFFFNCVFRHTPLHWHPPINKMQTPWIYIIAEYMIIIFLNDYYSCLGNDLSTEGIGYQWEGARTWPSRYNEKLWGSFCILLSSPTHWVSSEVSEKRFSFLVGHILKLRVTCLARPFDSKFVELCKL